MVEYHDIHKAFDAPVLTGVHLRVETGETMAVVGPSGTGKSVLLKTTIGLIVPDRGDVTIDGKSVYFSGHGTLEEIRQRVGYVFQGAALFDSMNVFENVSQGIAEARLKSMPRSELLARVARSLEHVNLDPAQVLAKLPSELSGGMRKRVGLARAIVGEPEILLYDEPVTGLDPVNAASIHLLIERLAEELDVTSILVTHDVHGALVIADHVAMLTNGTIRFVGRPEEFKNTEDPMVQAYLSQDPRQSLALMEAM
ncbi:MAG TPA: ATP-binding cassette domain-containing protein [Longimicrobiales bacterium]|nr:ATP-binding cassette domain-containing protein [Longimicrobiales bacterium]